MVIAKPTDQSACCGHGVTVAQCNSTYICDKCGKETGLRAPTFMETFNKKRSIIEKAEQKVRFSGVKNIGWMRPDDENYVDIPWTLQFATDTMIEMSHQYEQWVQCKKGLENQLYQLGKYCKELENSTNKS